MLYPQMLFEKSHKFEMPLYMAVYRIIYEGGSCVMIFKGLLERDSPNKEIRITDYK